MDYLRVKSDGYGSRNTSVSTKKAVDSFCRYVGDGDIRFDRFDDTLLGEWAARLLYNGYSPATVSFYIKRLSALYSKAVQEGFAIPTDSFSNIQARLNAPEAMRFNGISDRETFHKLQKIVRSDYSANPDRQLAKDMLLFAVYVGGMTFEEIVKYRKDDYKGENRHILDIVDKYARRKNKYLFPLDHSTRNIRQLCRYVKMLLQDLLSAVDIKLSPNAASTAIDIWCMAAMHCGFSASDIEACVAPHTATNVVTAFATASEAEPDKIAGIRSRIVEALTDNSVHWYVMRFRHGVDYDMVMARLKEKNISLEEIYYPMEEILRKVGHRKVFETRPVISWLMFFREHASELDSLYRQIGDLAWGYRRSRDNRSPYAVISPDEIKMYQMAVGTFSSDTELYTEGTLELKPGDRLIVLGGFLGGRPATFESTVNTAGARTIYRILLDGGNYKEWVVDQDPRLVKKISEQQFKELCRRYMED